MPAYADGIVTVWRLQKCGTKR